MTRVAAIDCGTNSLRLLIADLSQDAHGTATLTEVERVTQIVRLGHGVDRTGRFDEEALDRTLRTVAEYTETIRAHGVPLDREHVRFAATSAARDATNRDELLGGVESLLGVRPEVISGGEEAALSFRGAVSVLGAGAAASGAKAPEGSDLVEATPRTLMVDLGGGSTELVLGASEPESSVSMNIGCVRLTERHVRNDPASVADLAAVRTDVEAALDGASALVDVSEASIVVGVAGTITTITAHALGLASYDREAIHGARLPLWVVVAAANDLASMTRVQRTALPYMHPGRVDVIVAGATVWATILERVAAVSTVDEVLTSESDILDGIALSLDDAD